MKNEESTRRIRTLGQPLWFFLAVVSMLAARPASLYGTTTGIDRAEQGTPSETEKQVTLHADAFFRYNPSGVMLLVGGYHRWVHAKDEETGGPRAYAQAGAAAGINPAYGQLAVHAEWMPAAFVKIRVQYDLLGFFGTNGSLLSFPSEDEKFGDDEVDALSGQEESGFGHRFMFQPVLQYRIGRLVLRNRTDLACYLLNGRGPYFFEWEYDNLVEDGGVLLNNVTQLLLQAWHGEGAARLLAGPFYQFTRAESTRQRTGMQVFYVPSDALWFADRPRAFLRAGVNLEDRNREDEFFAVMGLGFDLDL